MDWSELSLSQTGNQVTGTYRQWGYAITDPANAGTVTGTVTGNVLSGTFDDNEGDGAASFTLTQDESLHLTGSWSFGGVTSPWCGVVSGNALPQGCGWSDTFTGANADGPITLTQTGQEVTGGYAEGQLAGIVSDFRLNGVFYSASSVDGHFSWAWTDTSETAFAGNSLFAGSSTYGSWCGAKGSATPPDLCLGGGGIYDGTWFTNIGVVTVHQPLFTLGTPVTATTTPTGSWFLYGDGIPATYAFESATVTASGLSWTDSSAGAGPGGATNLLASYATPQSLTLGGQGNDGSLWCGSVFAADPFQNYDDFIGVMPQGCGMTDAFNLYAPTPSDGSPTPTSATITQRIDAISGVTDSGGDYVFGYALTTTPASAPWVNFTGTAYTSAANPINTFNWYPAPNDATFRGDLGGDAAWCGNTASGVPSSCDR
jgi:hypothetical protein